MVKIVGLTILFIAVLCVKNVYAHPGNTANDGCHYCRTNCERWGEVYGERHCHNGSYTPDYEYEDPDYEFYEYDEPYDDYNELNYDYPNVRDDNSYYNNDFNRSEQLSGWELFMGGGLSGLIIAGLFFLYYKNKKDDN